MFRKTRAAFKAWRARRKYNKQVREGVFDVYLYHTDKTELEDQDMAAWEKGKSKKKANSTSIKTGISGGIGGVVMAGLTFVRVAYPDVPLWPVVADFAAATFAAAVYGWIHGYYADKKKHNGYSVSHLPVVLLCAALAFSASGCVTASRFVEIAPDGTKTVYATYNSDMPLSKKESANQDFAYTWGDAENKISTGQSATGVDNSEQVVMFSIIDKLLGLLVTPPVAAAIP